MTNKDRARLKISLGIGMPGGLHQLYDEALFRAGYYRWSALRRDTLPGNDPVSGRSRAHGEAFRSEGTAAYLAMARHWVNRASHYRRWGRVLGDKLGEPLTSPWCNGYKVR